MMDVEDDVPDSGAAFTFGKSKFASDLPGKFWIRDDPILQVSCGDEHTAFLTASGRVFTFGSNEWGQLGHGHTNVLTKPSCVKSIKHERATVLACGRSHTLVATDMGHIYGFGANSEGQLGSPNEYAIHSSPVRIQGLEDVAIKMLSAGADQSIALTDKGVVYVWGGGSEGQLGLEKSQCLVPTELKLESSVMCISAGYYHSAFVTVEGKLYTCGENECGKLGLPETNIKKAAVPSQVLGISGRVVYAACGGSHTVALTADGKAYSFGNGFNGQLGLGDRIVEASSPHLVTFLGNDRIARVSCGENHTGFLTDTGRLYSCGDRRHGKLGLLEDKSDMYCSQFLPTLVSCFQNFQVQQVACGGCHTLVLAIKRRGSVSKATEKGGYIPKTSMYVCPERNRKNIVLPPLNSSSSSSSIQSGKGSILITPVKQSHHPRLPSLSKSPVWYIPLERVSDSTGQEQSSDDEVLCKLEQRCSLLDDLESDESIRHVDSDVESDIATEVPELNKTHTLVRIDNTISIVRPVIADDKSEVSSSEDIIKAPDKLKEVETQHTDNNQNATIKNVNPHITNHVPSEEKDSFDKVSVSGKQTLKTKEKKSHFYDTEDKGISTAKSSSSLSKSSKACVLV